MNKSWKSRKILEVTECTPDELQACHEKLKK